MEEAATPFHMRTKRCVWDPTHNETMQLESSSRIFFPGLRTTKKEEKKKTKTNINIIKEEYVSLCPSISPGSSAYTAPPSWPTDFSGLGCAWTQSSMLFKRMHNLSCLWPFCVPARYINRSQVKPTCLIAHFWKIKAYVPSVVNKVTHTRHLFSLRVSKARSVVWGEETAT